MCSLGIVEVMDHDKAECVNIYFTLCAVSGSASVADKLLLVVAVMAGFVCQKTETVSSVCLRV